MPEISDVILDEAIETEWGNAIRDRTVQRYASATARASAHSSPSAGDLSYLEDTGDVDVYHSGSWRHLGDAVGTIKMHAGGSTPPGWLVCNGQEVSRTTYAALYAQIGDTWGEGDGSTTFAVPDLRGRVPRGVAASGDGDAVGDTLGSDTHTHTGPSHTHDSGTLSGGTTGSAHSHTSVGDTGSAGSHSHSNPATSSVANHSHTFSDSFTTGSNNNAELAASGSGSVLADAPHSHSGSVSGTTSSAGGHSHSQGDTGSAGSHSHSVPDIPSTNSAHTHTVIGSTAAGGTGNTGSASTIPAAAAVVFLIKT